MNDVERSRLLGRINYKGDVSLRGALRNCRDVDVMPAKRSKQLPGNAWVAFHLVTDDRDDCLIWFFVERCELMLKFKPKFLSHCGRGGNGINCAHGKTNCVLGRSLGNENDVHAARRKRAKESLGNPGNTDHAQSAKSQQ